MTQLSRRFFAVLIPATLVAAAVLIAGRMAAVRAETPSPPPPPQPPADGPTYDLRYKLKIGDVLRYEVTHSASIQSTIDGTTQAAQTRTDSVKLWKVTDVLPSGEIEFMNVVERVAMTNQLPDHDPVKYDSERDKSPPPGFEDAAKAIGVPLSVIRMTPRGEITRRDVKFRPGRAEEDAPIVVRLPDEPVAIGATWDEPFDIKIEQQNGVFKPIQTRRHCKLVDVQDDLATIEVTYQILTPVDPPEEAQLVQRMLSGVARFDIAAGRLIGQRMEVDKRILGFAGPTSSMQYVMRMEEKLVPAPKSVAARPSEPPLTTSSTAPSTKQPPETASDSAAVVTPPVKSPSQSAATTRRSTRPSRTASRSRSNPQSARGYRR